MSATAYSLDEAEVRDALREGDIEYEYHDECVSISATESHKGVLEIGHFNVQRDQRGNGYADVLLDALIAVAHEDRITTLTCKIGATECRTMEELETYREVNDADDPTGEFLTAREFRDITPKETHKWGVVFEAHRRL